MSPDLVGQKQGISSFWRWARNTKTSQKIFTCQHKC